jgi:homoserine dehydrogenase
MHVITANKGPVVHAFRRLSELARRRGRHFYFESAVMDGAPIFSLWRTALPGARLQSFRGILNSTTNLILTLMEDGQTFDEAVAQAQTIGVAETDPSGDILGWDAAVKVAALVTVLMDFPLLPQQVDRQGIEAITPSLLREAGEQGRRWKLICQAERGDGGVRARVAPELIGPEDPLHNVMGTSSSITFISDVLGRLTVTEENPGPGTTAYGLLADFINAVRTPMI